MKRCSGRGAVRLARLHGVQEVEGSNPFAPTKEDDFSRVVIFFSKDLPKRG